ncbi:Leucyl-tRNA synthetase, mitochondrial, partial [Ascosphaera aggregata]
MPLLSPSAVKSILFRKGLEHSILRAGNGCIRFRQAFSIAIPNKKLDLLAIDRKWKQRWREDPFSQLQKHDGAEKAYILAMFPYPSGTLHMGHVRVYTISDVLARYKHMCGFDVLHPMGWDAFGLPAENAAIERGIDPAKWTEQNIANMKMQLDSIGARFDWDEKIFLMLREKGLAYQAKAVVNYDPVDKTVLANEQVDANGCSWRSGAKVEKKELTQWFFKITAFKEALLTDLDSLKEGWPERVLSQQRHWLGKSIGAKVKFQVFTAEGAQDVEVFTTRPDTLHGVQYLALSLTHPLIKARAKKTPELQAFIDFANDLGPETKAGFLLPDVIAHNPIASLERNSAVASRIPVYAAPYVLSDYGEGAVMGVPGHDTRDLAFWKENGTSDEALLVVEPESGDFVASTHIITSKTDSKAFTGRGFLTNRCGSYAGMTSSQATEAIVEDLKERTGRAQFSESWRLRDWLISRQRYWGTPIPIIHCVHCGPVPVPDEDLPVMLPQIDAAQLKSKPGNPLEKATEWLRTKCPSCGADAKRDTDTMDTFVDSSWYALRYLDAHNTERPFSSNAVRPVDIYVGGVEHAILHLLYARFIYKFLATSDLVPNDYMNRYPAAEPFKTLLTQGMVHGKTFKEPSTQRFLKAEEVDLSNPNAPLIKGTNTTPLISYEKMSKSKYNGVDPTSSIEKYGADAVRAHILFSAPVSEILEWEESKIVGIQRWYNRVWKATTEAHEALARAPFTIGSRDVATINELALPPLEELSQDEVEVLLAADSTIKSVTNCLENTPYGLNTVISDLTKFTNTLSSSALNMTVDSTVSSSTSAMILYITTSILLRLLAPIGPALSSECWTELHKQPLMEVTDEEVIPSIFSAPWPKPLLSDKDIAVLKYRGAKSVGVQINGRLRFSVQIPRWPGSGEGDQAEQENDWI